MPSLQQAFDQLALSSSSPAPSTDPHPSTFITKPLPSLPDGSNFTRCSSTDPGGWSGVVGRNDRLDARQAEFGLPRPPNMADRPPEQWKERVDPRSGQVNSHKREGTGRLGSCDGPSSARHSMPAAPTSPHAGGPYRRHPFDPRLASSSPLGSTFASTSAVPSPPLYPMPGTTRPTRAELLNARFHPSPSSQNASSSLHTTPSNSGTPLVDPPSYSIFDSLAVGRPPIPPLSTRPTNLTPHIHTRPVSQTNPLSQPNAPNSSSTIANVRPSLQAAYSAPPTATRFVNSPAAPSTPCRRAQSSSQPSPSPSSPASPAKQCAGFTQKGQRCRNRLKSSSESGGDGYCRLHRTMILKETGVYVGGGGRTWVEFSDWIPGYLDEDTQASLRVEMEKPLSLADKTERGFIYAFEYRGLQTDSTRTFKLGLSRNPILRIDQWASQCPSHDPLLLGVLPGGLTGRLRGVREQGGEGMRGSRRLERLVHLEIGGMGQRSREECVDCKKVHQELFPLKRLPSGREWEDVIFPVMHRWERFVRLVGDEERG